MKIKTFYPIGKKNLTKTKMDLVIESLIEILADDAAYLVTEEGGWIKLVAGVIKCDRMALSKLMGYWGGSSQSREGIYCDIFFGKYCHYIFELGVIESSPSTWKKIQTHLLIPYRLLNDRNQQRFMNSTATIHDCEKMMMFYEELCQKYGIFF